MNIEQNIFSMKDPRKELMTFDDSCIDLLVTAPPAFAMTGKESNGTSYSWETFDEYTDYMGAVFTEVYRVLKNQHYCVISIGVTTTRIGERQWDKKTFPLAAHFINLLEWIGFTYVTEYVTDKGRKSILNKWSSAYFPFMVSPVSSLEHVLVFVKKDNKDTPVSCPRCGSDNVGHWGYNKKGDRQWVCKNRKCPGNCFGVGPVYTEVGKMINSRKIDENIIPNELVDRWSRGVVQVSPMFSKEINQRYLPAEVAEMAVLFYSGVGDVVLDPFSGIGTTLMTAIKYKRRFVCFERDDHDRKLFLGGLLAYRKFIEKARAEIGCENE
ncbi:MAG: site-specific DNA-methyltransferase [Ruminococcus sp.]|nr:site-specific DNA-methyltransferase [Ruminococcus sp.]